jgi:hypothetical protein
MLIDEDDLGMVALFGGIPLLIICIIVYFVFSKPEIDKCHEEDGVIVKIEGEHRCIDEKILHPTQKDPS